MAGLRDLAEQLGGAGVQVELAVTGERDLPEALQFTVYRIVQEGLTNVVRHAGPGTGCRVTVDMSADRVDVQVEDDGAGRPGEGGGSGGHGLIGLRERVAMYGGTLRAGTRPEGGFTLAASLPSAQDIA
ncbi:sensor histidine kinase [Actinomadura adrarensis]|uniref:histidine kinase n=1 Tax=Actinomadura adrarensis TaxID=1819600 RepID=A0ABW3CEJ5_9ACTN